MLVLASGTGLRGGFLRDVLIGAAPPAALDDWRYLLVPVPPGSSRSCSIRRWPGWSLCHSLRRGGPRFVQRGRSTRGDGVRARAAAVRASRRCDGRRRGHAARRARRAGPGDHAEGRAVRHSGTGGGRHVRRGLRTRSRPGGDGTTGGRRHDCVAAAGDDPRLDGADPARAAFEAGYAARPAISTNPMRLTPCVRSTSLAR